METESASSPLPVDLIRTIAIIFVILLHASNESILEGDFMSPAGIQLWWASNIYGSIARVAVPLFIMLTGALLLQPNKADEPLRVYFKKRWNRIGIPVIFWGIIFFAWSSLIKGQTLTGTSIFQGILAGPYSHFWYVYLLIGLYLITPIIRVVIAHANWNIIRYFLWIWFIGTGIVSLMTLSPIIRSESIWFRENIFILTGMIGYFILGAYITKVKIRFSIVYLMLVLSILWTIFATYFLISNLGERYSTFFFDASSFSIIIASVSLFLILAAIPNKILETKVPSLSKVLKIISLNTLPIYLFHIIILESLQQGYFGLKISVTTINPIIEIPIITFLTLLISLIIIFPLKKLPYVGKIIG